MKELDILREQIDEIDEQIAFYLKKRFNTAQKIGEIKRKEGLEIVNKQREEAVISKVASSFEDDRRQAAIAVYEQIIKQCVLIQK